MNLTPNEVASIFRESEPLPKRYRHLQRERGQAFVETMISEIETMKTEDNPWLEAGDLGE